jgi:hypothetical protein
MGSSTIIGVERTRQYHNKPAAEKPVMGAMAV